MLGIDSSEFMLIGVVALVVIGPKDLPRFMRTAGTWVGKAQRMSSHVRAGVDEMIRQAEATAGAVAPASNLPTTSSLLTKMLMTPDTRSKEPGGEDSKVAPLRPGALAASFAPLVSDENDLTRENEAGASVMTGHIGTVAAMAEEPGAPRLHPAD